MRVVIVENNVPNLNRLTDIIKALEPNAKVKGFVNGNEAIEWCNENAFCIDLFIGNWWGVDEEYNSPEGANVYNLVKWFKKPKKILVADDQMFEQWAYNDGAIGFIQRPVTTDKLKRILETESQSAKELSNEDLTFVNAAGVPDMSYGAAGENTNGTDNLYGICNSDL